MENSTNKYSNNTSDVILEGTQVSIGYRSKKKEVVVHNDLNFSLHRGELTCLLGANGSGKSTLLRTLSAVQPSLKGSITLMGKMLHEYSEKERSRSIGVVLTEKTQTGGLTIYELVSLGRQPHTGFFGRLNKEDKAIIEHAIEAVGITRLSASYMAEVSDGERQKAFIAKALVQECPLIILDEPTAFLDVVSRIEIMTLLRRLAIEEKKAILLSTHDIDQALLLADRLWLLTREKGIICGVTEDLILSNQLAQLFPDSEIRFDNLHGGFIPLQTYQHVIHLEAADEYLFHWSQNALNRIGYQCIDKTIERPETNIPGTITSLKVSSKNELQLTLPRETQAFSSFEELLNTLKKDTSK